MMGTASRIMELLFFLMCFLTAVHAAHQRNEDPSRPCLPILPLPHKPAPRTHQLEPGIQLILPTYEFSCHGKITSWGVLVKHTHARRNTRIDLQIWRPAFGGYDLVEVDSLAGEVEEERGRVSVQLGDTAQQLTVQPGDIVGLFVGREGLRVRAVPVRGVGVWFYQTGSPGSRYFNLSNETLQRNDRAPLIELTVVSRPANSSVSAPECTTSTSSTSSSSSSSSLLPISTSPITDFEVLMDPCDSGGLLPLLLISIVMVIILLAAVFLLGIALVVVYNKMRKLGEECDQLLQLLNNHHSTLPPPLPSQLSSFIGTREERRESFDNPSYSHRTAHTINHTGAAEYEEPLSPPPPPSTQLGCFQLNTTTMQSDSSYGQEGGGGGGSDSNHTGYYESLDCLQPAGREPHPHTPMATPSLSTLPQDRH